MSRVFLAGAESLELLTTLVNAGAKDIMVSFYYLQQRGALPKFLGFIKNHPTLHILIDSGAFTFAQKDRGDPQAYWRAYYEFLRGRGHLFAYATEFDIDGYTWQDKLRARTVSTEQIDVWRDDLADLKTVPIIPIWHASRGLDVWDHFCSDVRFPHLGISKGEGSDFSRGASNKKGGEGRIFKGGGSAFSNGAIAKMIAKAHTTGKTVHGYGTPALTDLRQMTFDTFSSAAWLVGQKFGDVCIFERGRYQRLYASQKQGKKDRQTYRKYFTRIGCDWKKIEADDRQEINIANALAWINLSARLQVMRPTTSHLRLVTKPIQPQERPETPLGAPISPVPDSPHPSEASKAVERLPALPRGRILPLVPVGESVSVATTTETPISFITQKPFFPPNTPGLHCSICAMAMECPKYQEGATCAFKASFSVTGTRDVNQVVEELGGLFSVNVERARYARLAEELTGGGVVSKDVTQHMETTFGMGVKLAELMKGRKRTTTTVQGEGMMDRLFGNHFGAPQITLDADTKSHVVPEVIEADPQVHGTDDEGV